MKQKQRVLGALAGLALAIAMPLQAQMNGGMSGSGAMHGNKTMGPGMQPMHANQQGTSSGMKQMSALMLDMGIQMVRMSKDVAHGEMSAERHQQMMEQMQQMQQMMGSMSGMMSSGMMMNAPQQQQMEHMRQQLDNMGKSKPAMP